MVWRVPKQTFFVRHLAGYEHCTKCDDAHTHALLVFEGVLVDRRSFMFAEILFLDSHTSVKSEMGKRRETRTEHYLNVHCSKKGSLLKYGYNYQA